MKNIRFKGKKYLLINGAIATPEQFENFECSYAHLFPNGEIKRFNEVIGHESDIEYLSNVGKKREHKLCSNGAVNFYSDPLKFFKNAITTRLNAY